MDLKCKLVLKNMDLKKPAFVKRSHKTKHKTQQAQDQTSELRLGLGLG